MKTATKRRKKRKHRKLADAELLEAIQAERFDADEEGHVYAVNGRRRLLATYLDHQERPCLYVYYDQGRRNTTVARIVWMIVHRECVPDGFAVDHLDRDRFNNRPANLRLLESQENSRQNQYYDDF